MDDKCKLEFANTLPLTRRDLAVIGLLSLTAIFIIMLTIKWYPPVLLAAALTVLIAVIIVVKGTMTTPVSIAVGELNIVLKYSSGKERVVSPEHITVISPADVVYPGCFSWVLGGDGRRQWGFVAVGSATKAMLDRFPETRERLSGRLGSSSESIWGKRLSAQAAMRFRRILMVNVVVTGGIFIPLVLLVFTPSLKTLIATVLMLVTVDCIMCVFLYVAMLRTEAEERRRSEI